MTRLYISYGSYDRYIDGRILYCLGLDSNPDKIRVERTGSGPEGSEMVVSFDTPELAQTAVDVLTAQAIPGVTWRMA